MAPKSKHHPVNYTKPTAGVGVVGKKGTGSSKPGRGDRLGHDRGNNGNGDHKKNSFNSLAKDGDEEKSHGSLEENDDDAQSIASSLSSTPILVLKRLKKVKQRGSRVKNRPAAAAAGTTSTRKSDKPVATKKKQGPNRKTDRTKVDNNDAKKTAKGKPSNTTRQVGSKNVKMESKTGGETKDDSTSSSSEEEEAACCLCFCGVDCSDRALFFPKDRKEELEDDEDYYFGMDDPYLDETFYDRNNTLVYCDSCNRLYHQKCHFVPLLVVPRGDWNCLMCSIQQQSKPAKSTPSSANKRKSGATHGNKDSQSLPIHDKVEWKKFLDRKITDQLFQTPSRMEEIQNNASIATVDVKSLQKEWEIASAWYKAQLWYRHLKQLKTFLTSQASNIRRTNTALATMTSTKRNRQHFSGKGAKSQELAQTIVHQTGAKFKIRDAFISLETLRTKDEPVDFSSLVSWCQQHPEHAAHVFPFGSDMWQENRRIVPRTKERALANAQGNQIDGSTTKSNRSDIIVPSEIHINGKNASKAPTKSTESATRGEKKSHHAKTSRTMSKAKKEKKDVDDDDSGISLDDLQCCVCMIGDSTDENDLILCDGQNCHRAFHMKCVHPAVRMEDLENEDEHWFCPLCTGVSTLMGEMHDLCIGSEDPDIDDDDESMDSWDDVNDIFPDSEWEYQTAVKLLKGKRNADTQRLLALYLGEDISDQPEQMPIGSDSEDENNYSLFDEESFEERKRRDREEEENSDSDDSTRSSQATLVEMSSVEDIDKGELAALAAEEGNALDSSTDDESEEHSDEGRIRKSRRLRKRSHRDDDDSGGVDNGADFSESNIIEGKRKRKRVDYRKLNDALFGGLNEKQRRQIDDKEEFKMERQTRKKKTSSESEDSSSGGDEDSSATSSPEGSDDEDGSNDENSESNGGGSG